MKKWLTALLLALPAALWAQEIPPYFQQIVTAYDLASASLTYPLLAATPVNGPATIKTAGASTTFVEAVVGTAPFALVKAGDLLFIRLTPTTTVLKTVVTRTSDASIVVDGAAVDLGTAGLAFQFRSLTDGTGAAQGWVTVSKYSQKNFVFQLDTINATSIDVQIECKVCGPGGQGCDYSASVKVYPPVGGSGQCGTGNFTVAGITARCAVVATEPWDQCRVGYKINTDTGVQAITAAFFGRSRQ